MRPRKTCNPVARQCRPPAFRKRIVRDRATYGRRSRRRNDRETVS